MDTLKLTDLNLAIKPKNTDRLFYDEWKYCLGFYVENLHTMRNPEMPLQAYQRRIITRFESRRTTLLKFGQRSIKNLGGSWRATQDPDFMSQSQLDCLLELAEVLDRWAGQCKLVVAGSHGYLYANNPRVFDDIHQANLVKVYNLREAHVTKPRDTVSLKSSQYSKRSYFRERTMTQEENERLVNFLTSQTDLRLGPAVKNWIQRDHSGFPTGSRPWFCSQRYWFMDHDNDGIVLMLEMIVPRIIRKTTPIQVNN